jgi:branched-chain amino acid transport system substrate-binding protein
MNTTNHSRHPRYPRLVTKILAMVFIGVMFAMPMQALGQEKKIVIGGSIPLTGAAAETGLNVYNGYKAAVKFVNEELGGVEVGGQNYKLELDLFDDASDPSRATTLIQRQLDEGVNFFLGSFGSNIVLPTCSITERAQRPMVQAGGGSDLIFTQGRKFVFGIFQRASRQQYSFRDYYLSLKPRPETFSIILENDPYSKWSANGAKDTLTEAGFKLLDVYELPAQVSDVSSVLASVRQKQPDMLLCVTHDQVSMLIAKQMITTNTYAKVLYQGLGPQTVAYRESLGKYANEVLVALYFSEKAPYKGEIIGSAKDFADYYRSNFKRPLVYHMASAAACIVAYVHAFKNADSLEPVKVRDALDKLDVMTFYGRVKFTEDGDMATDAAGTMVGQVQDGEVELVYPPVAATADPIYPFTPWNER